MRNIQLFKSVNEMPKKLRNKVIGIILNYNEYYNFEDILSLTNLFVLYDNRKVYSIAIHYGELTQENHFFFIDNKKINIFTIEFYKDEEDSKELLNYLNNIYEHILIWRNDFIYQNCVPDNFNYQIQYKDNISILSDDNYLFDYCYISNLPEDYFLNLYLEYQHYNKVNVDEIEYKLIDNLYEFLYDKVSGNYRIPICYNSTPYLKLCDPSDTEGKHIIGLYKNILVFDLCIKTFDNKEYLYHISTRKDLSNQGIASKGIEFLSNLNFYDKIYSTILTEDGKKAHINDKMSKCLKDRFIIK